MSWPEFKYLTQAVNTLPTYISGKKIHNLNRKSGLETFRSVGKIINHTPSF